MSGVDWLALFSRDGWGYTGQDRETSDRILATRVPQLCQTCGGSGRVACPGPSFLEPKTKMQRDALGMREGIDYCYGMHMGHDCPHCPTVERVLNVGAQTLRSTYDTWVETVLYTVEHGYAGEAP